MKIVINVTTAALVLFASVPAFAHGGGMGHMGGNMGSNMGMVNHQTVIRTHDGDHHDWRFTKTTKTIDKTHITHLKTFKFRKVVRIEREIRRLRLELIRLRLEGRGNSFEARRLLFRVVELGKLINS
jgi:hypothetical protein